jgi:hypothetical protein
MQLLKKIKNYIYIKPRAFEKFKENKRKILIKFLSNKKPIIFDVGFHRGVSTNFTTRALMNFMSIYANTYN